MTPTPEQARIEANRHLATLYATVTDWDTALLDQAINAIGGGGRPFSMNDVRAILPDTVQGAAGLYFHSLVRRRNPQQLVIVGEEPSTAASTHGKPIKVYVLSAERLAQQDRRAA